MFRKSMIFAVLGASLAAPVMASEVNPGVAMQAKILGVAPGEYTADELIRLDTARSEGDTITEQVILSKTQSSSNDMSQDVVRITNDEN